MTKLRCGYFFGILVLCTAMSACTLTGTERAPIIDAGTSVPGGDTAAPPQVSEGVYHTVQAGDSLYRIASKYGQRWQDVASWNNIAEPYTLSIGQVLLVTPGSDAQAGVTPGTTPPKPPSSGTIEPVPTALENRMQWTWPAKGSVIAGFNGGTNKGIDIAGKAGDPVYAAADGRVAYVGSGLRGYGNLVIIKHNDVFVTAYAHNQKILVQENQVVHKGEQIAEMGNTDAQQVMLHFEVRQQSQEGGSPVDPMKYLPAR